jgi:hypothetical protein
VKPPRATLEYPSPPVVGHRLKKVSHISGLNYFGASTH